MISSVAHLADIHIKDYRFEKEYKYVFEKVIEQLKIIKPDRIVVAGDIVHTKNNVRNEAKILAGWFLNQLAAIAKVIVINGNHDGNPNNKDQVNSLYTIIELINNPNIYYFNTTRIVVDDNIEWYVWDYFDEKNPWDGVNIMKDHLKKENFKIDLYHNPIQGAKMFNGNELHSTINVNDFKGDAFLLGDIHKRQFYTNNEGAVGGYPGSLVQQDYGEATGEHGFVVWNIKKNKLVDYEIHDIDNQFVYYNLVLDNEKNIIDFENEDELPDYFTGLKSLALNYQYIRVKVKWKDYRSNINKENERKIHKIIKSILGDKILEVKVEKESIDRFEGLRSLLMTVNKEDVLDENSLKDIFVRFLTANKTDKITIDKVTAFDQFISKDLVLEEKLVNWRLLSISLDNYRSHGDKFTLDINDKDGLWQIKGLNEQGKTNLLSAICYLLFGKTMETLKKEKNGDNRFINNKRDLDYCEVSGMFEINGELYELVRRTDRTWNKGKTEFKTLTSLDYKKLDAGLNEISLNDEQRRKTEKLVTQDIGTFDDFLRTSFITADSLNGLLSSDEAVFIDSILRDAGLDIFEKKGQMFKDWKKNNPIKKPKIVIEDAQNEVYQNEQAIIGLKEEYESLEGRKAILKTKMAATKDKLEKEQKKWQKVDTTTTLKDIENYNKIILEAESAIYTHNELIAMLEDKIKGIPDIFEGEDSLQELKESYNKTIKEQEEIKELITEITRNISDLKNKLEVNEIKTSNKLETVKVKKREQHTLLSNQNEKIEAKEKEIEKLENSKICVTCNRELDNKEVLDIIAGQVKELKETLEAIKSDKKIEEQLKLIKEDSAVLLEEVEVLETESKSIQDKINNFKGKLQLAQQTDIDYKLQLSSIKKLIDNSEEEKAKIERKQIELQKIERYQLINKNHKTEIKTHEKLISDFSEVQKKLEINKLIEETIADLKEMLRARELELETINARMTTIDNAETPKAEKRIIELNNLIDEYLIEEEKEKVQSLYQDCIHRDGIPRMLLNEMRETINIELSNLLISVGFNVFFDENLNLKMYDEIKPEAVLHVIGGSGKQRTFISIALRLALRQVNNRCVNNLLFMDELMGKLVDNSVTEFIQLLEEAKLKIEKIFIVEHAYSDQLNPDHIIEIKKDAEGVSQIKLY